MPRRLQILKDGADKDVGYLHGTVDLSSFVVNERTGDVQLVIFEKSSKKADLPQADLGDKLYQEHHSGIDSMIRRMQRKEQKAARTVRARRGYEEHRRRG